MLTLPLALLALSATAFATPTTSRYNLKTLVTTTTPAAACSSAAPFACEPGDAFCCAESTQCVAEARGAWACRVTDRLANALACGASDTACTDGVTCCPEDMACAPGGGCVSTDLDLGSDDAGDEDPDAGLEQCEDGETLCATSCCTEAEACDTQTGMCVAPDGRPPAPAVGKNATTAGALLSGNETVPDALVSGKNATATPANAPVTAGVSNAAETRTWGMTVVTGGLLAVVVARAVRAVHG